MSAIGRALLGLAVDGIDALGDFIRERRRRRNVPPHEPPPWERNGHNWQRHLRNPPLCAWCSQELTVANQHGPCPGPGTGRQA